jgi:MoaA/NifB/PqqE/SkfB family radical SAM enzyme
VEPVLKNIESIFLGAARLHRGGVLKKGLRLEGLAWKTARSAVLRWVRARRGLAAPVAIALSPTMRCNLACAGCYAVDYPRGTELPLETIDRVLADAAAMGVFLVIVTGGEPLLRDGIVPLLSKHRRLLFLLVTNGTLVDRERARALAGSRNIVPVVSLEGPRKFTDGRRGDGAYDAGVRAMAYLDEEEALFGFSATVTAENCTSVVGDDFVGEMVRLGCSLAFYTEYVPVGTRVQPEWVLGDEKRRAFREAVLAMRRQRPIIAVHLPDDEYDRKGRCLGVTGGCVHVNAQGQVEPCPFAHYAADSIAETPLGRAVDSVFLSRLRSSSAVVRRGHIGCALVENRDILEAIARETGARSTETCPSVQEVPGTAD